MRFLKSGIAAAGLAALVSVADPAPVAAHPHVWIDAAPEVIFDDEGRVTALKMRWTFDALYSSFAMAGIDANKNKIADPDELALLAKQNTDALKDFKYFTLVRKNGENVPFAENVSAENIVVDGALVMTLNLPLAEPIDPAKHHMSFASFDPTYYIAISVKDASAVSVVKAPAGCAAQYSEAGEAPQNVSDSVVNNLSDNWAAQFAPTITVTCNG